MKPTRDVEYKDELGRRWLMTIPAEAADEDALMGICRGPADLDPLGLPEAITTKLHNELYARGIIRSADARRRRSEVIAAISSALKLDAQAVIDLFED